MIKEICFFAIIVILVSAQNCKGCKCPGKSCIQTESQCVLNEGYCRGDGTCYFGRKSNGSPCDDKNHMTIRDTCREAVCVGVDAKQVSLASNNQSDLWWLGINVSPFNDAVSKVVARCFGSQQNLQLQIINTTRQAWVLTTVKQCCRPVIITATKLDGSQITYVHNDGKKTNIPNCFVSSLTDSESSPTTQNSNGGGLKAFGLGFMASICFSAIIISALIYRSKSLQNEFEE
eukprot:NODE_6826_length_839_cov_33.037709_g6227_i0.p1 GENE.NODE_6826_length_839_cov_33.037709_g6227_i0~~NODE_6826_length_839_cov_33.037709_g6227_i0.p1  ORF type:complete len:250 (-),score=47.60 NODE_6826_length_839_cov_33.037709_g6227_i0:89-784(-)